MLEQAEQTRPVMTADEKSYLLQLFNMLIPAG